MLTRLQALSRTTNLPGRCSNPRCIICWRDFVQWRAPFGTHRGKEPFGPVCKPTPPSGKRPALVRIYRLPIIKSLRSPYPNFHLLPSALAGPPELATTTSLAITASVDMLLDLLAGRPAPLSEEAAPSSLVGEGDKPTEAATQADTVGSVGPTTTAVPVAAPALPASLAPAPMRPPVAVGRVPAPPLAAAGRSGSSATKRSASDLSTAPQSKKVRR